ncbi:hypothetical protein FQR65_LT16779 [Abscondita terminalis]|nr:hypothetical protein FQR65_LT16779 [Abscondita terminalis]
MTSEDNIFITGVAGIFPKLKNVEELYVAIANKKQMLSSMDSYWKTIAPELASSIGKQPLNEKFDAGFFGVHYKLAEGMHQRVNPTDLKGSKTGVFVATSHVECDGEWMTHKLTSPNFGVATNSDGFKEAGLTFPSTNALASVFQDAYEGSGVDPVDVSFVECHITGTAEELKAVESVFCAGRHSPLFIGSVKANVGHAESASGLVSMIKVLLGLQHNCILPNPDCHKISSRADSLRNALKHHHKIKIPTPKLYSNRLVCFSARTKDSLTKIAASFKDNVTEEYLTLLQNMFRYNIYNYNHRGFVILNNDQFELSSFNHCLENLQLCLVFPGLTIQFLPFLDEIQQNKALSESFKKICDVLQAKNSLPFNLWNENRDLDFGERILGIIIFQLTVVDALKNILQKPIDVVESCCSGAIAEAFALETLSLENSVMLALKLRSRLNTETNIAYGNCTFLNCQNPIKHAYLVIV